MDARADIYALGAVAYLLLSGHPPFAGKTLVELCSHHLHSKPLPLSERSAGVPADLDQVVLTCLAKEPAARPDSASALAELLRACRDAGSWSEADAERWWSEVPRLKTEPASGEGHTLLRADVKDRLRAR